MKIDRSMATTRNLMMIQFSKHPLLSAVFFFFDKYPYSNEHAPSNNPYHGPGNSLIGLYTTKGYRFSAVLVINIGYQFWPCWS